MIKYLGAGQGAGSRAEMSLEHLFQHIISSERRARESRRWMQEGAGAPGHCGAFALCSGGLGAEGPQAVVGAPRGEGLPSRRRKGALARGADMGTPGGWMCLMISFVFQSGRK